MLLKLFTKNLTVRLSFSFLVLYSCKKDKTIAAPNGLTITSIVDTGCASTYLYAIDIATKSLIWKLQSAIGTSTGLTVLGAFSNPVVWNGSVYAGDINNQLYSLNATTGTKNWQYNVSGVQLAAAPGPTVANGVLFVNRQDKKLYAFNTTNGTIKWTFETGDIVNSEPCVVDTQGNVYYPGNSGDQN